MILDIPLNIEEHLGNSFQFTQVEQIGPLLSRIIGDIIAISAILFLLYLVWGGVQWLMSGGEKGSVAAAKSRISNALIGLIIVLASWAIFTLVRYMFGIQSTGSNHAPAGTNPPTSQIDCCTWGGNAPDCCNFLQSKEPPTYVHGRYQSSWEQCQTNHWIDWNLWRQNYQQEVGPGENDPCR